MMAGFRVQGWRPLESAAAISCKYLQDPSTCYFFNSPDRFDGGLIDGASSQAVTDSDGRPRHVVSESPQGLRPAPCRRTGRPVLRRCTRSVSTPISRPGASPQHTSSAQRDRLDRAFSPLAGVAAPASRRHGLATGALRAQRGRDKSASRGETGWGGGSGRLQCWQQ
jgi:hypothetical protein